MRLATKVLVFASLASVFAVATPLLATDHTVLMNGDYGGAMFFDPPSLTVHPGDRVRWMNAMIVVHTSTSGVDCAPDGGWTTGQLDPGETSAYFTFNTVGSFPYYCRFHCEIGMTGDIAVTQPPVRVQTSTWGRVKALFATASK